MLEPILPAWSYSTSHQPRRACWGHWSSPHLAQPSHSKTHRRWTCRLGHWREAPQLPIQVAPTWGTCSAWERARPCSRSELWAQCGHASSTELKLRGHTSLLWRWRGWLACCSSCWCSVPLSFGSSWTMRCWWRRVAETQTGAWCTQELLCICAVTIASRLREGNRILGFPTSGRRAMQGSGFHEIFLQNAGECRPRLQDLGGCIGGMKDDSMHCGRPRTRAHLHAWLQRCRIRRWRSSWKWRGLWMWCLGRTAIRRWRWRWRSRPPVAWWRWRLPPFGHFAHLDASCPTEAPGLGRCQHHLCNQDLH